MSEPRKRPQQTDEILVLDNEGIDRIRFYGWDRDITPPALWDAVHDRTERFQPVEECPELTVGERKSVGLVETPCPHYRGQVGIPSLRTVPQLRVGITTGLKYKRMVPCACVKAELFWQRWAGKRTMVHPRFQSAFLWNLQPSATCRVPVNVQGRMIDLMLDRPEDNYLFFGPTGCGKSTYLGAFHSYALAAWSEWSSYRGGLQASPEGVWRVDTHTLLQEHVDWNRRIDVARVNSTTGETTLEDPPPFAQHQVHSGRLSGWLQAPHLS